MVSTHWQQQNINLRRNVVLIAAFISVVLLAILVLGGMAIETAGGVVFFGFFIIRMILAFLLKNKYANSMVRVLKFDYEELERDFRIVFKNNFVRYRRRSEEDAYHYDFPGHGLTMTVQPYWLFSDTNPQAVTKVTLQILTAKNKAFAEMLANAIDEMADGFAMSQKNPDR